MLDDDPLQIGKLFDDRLEGQAGYRAVDGPEGLLVSDVELHDPGVEAGEGGPDLREVHLSRTRRHRDAGLRLQPVAQGDDGVDDPGTRGGGWARRGRKRSHAAGPDAPAGRCSTAATTSFTGGSSVGLARATRLAVQPYSQ